MYEGCNGEEFGAALPFQEARAFESQLGFTITDGDFDLPAAVVSEDDTPGIIDIGDWLMSDQIPGCATLARARNDQGKGEIGEIGNIDGQENDAGLA